MVLGRLEKIELRDIWKTEDRDFTPWLAQERNISLLGETLGLNLEVESQEKPVGPFRADILCKDLDEAEDHWVLIENQIERTDHRHLGQLMTYAAGLQAVTIIWIADRFTDEHRAAMDWLNNITDREFQFFGLEVELWKIGDSPAAPKFNVVSKPNEWSRNVSAATRAIRDGPLTATRQLQLQYWSEFGNELDDHKFLRPQSPRPVHYCNISIGKSGFKIGGLLYSNAERIGVEIYMNGEDANLYFCEFEKHRKEIEKNIGFELDWQPLSGKHACRIAIYKENCSPSDEARWPEYRTWMIENLEAIYGEFKPILDAIDIDVVREEGVNMEDLQG